MDSNAQGIYYTVNGSQHFIHQDEVNAIEASGRSTWQEYAQTPTVWHERPLTGYELMDETPGQTEPLIVMYEARQGLPWTRAEKQALVNYCLRGDNREWIAMAIGRSRAACETMWWMIRRGMVTGEEQTKRESVGIGYKTHLHGVKRCKTMNRYTFNPERHTIVGHEQFSRLDLTQRCSCCDRAFSGK